VNRYSDVHNGNILDPFISYENANVRLSEQTWYALRYYEAITLPQNPDQVTDLPTLWELQYKT
jgi:hypothetical protein